MFENSQDFLNVSLGIGFLVLVIFLSMVCFYLVLVLRDVSKATGEAEEIVSRVHSAIIQPLKALDFLVEKIKPYVETIIDQKIKDRKYK